MCPSDDLKEIVQKLQSIREYKRSLILLDESKYFRPRTQEEERETIMILGDKAKEHMRREDEERERLQRQYNELRQARRQLNPVTIYHTKKRIVISRNILGDNNVSGLIKKIFYDEFEPVMISDFSPWFNNRTLKRRDDGTIRSVKFLPDTIFNRPLIEEIVKFCKRYFLKNYHSYDIFKMMLRKNIYEYIAKVKDTRIKLKYKIPKYQFLFESFKVISSDFFDSDLRKNLSKRDPVLYTHI